MDYPTARHFTTSDNHCCRWKPLNTLNLFLEPITQNKPKGGLLDYIAVPLMTENIQNHNIIYYDTPGMYLEYMFSLKKPLKTPCSAIITPIYLSRLYYIVMFFGE